MYFIHFIIFLVTLEKTLSLWNENKITCPLVCTCRVEVFIETSIHRFIKSVHLEQSTANVNYNNEVFSDTTDEYAEKDEQSDLIQTAICVLQTETEIESLLDQLPPSLESLILIQGTDAGNKTLRTSSVKSRFEHLLVLELRGQTNVTTQVRELSCVIDEPLPHLHYVNFEYTKLINGRKNGINNAADYTNDVFQYTQPLENGKSLTFLQRNVDIRQPILPYSKYKSEAAHAPVTFSGFDKLLLLRITHAQLNSINYEMFVGLSSLQHLLLEDNDLRIIPEFAFYGTPSLKSLSLAGNNLLTIRIADLAGLMHLEYLDLARNNFTELSELSLPPFPELKLVNFADNPIGLIFPNTFEVLNTTKSVIVGGTGMPLKLMSNAFVGLIALQKLIVLNLRMDTLERDVFIGMPALLELQISSGYINHIAFDTFVDCKHLERLIVKGCHVYNISVDAFLGLSKLRLLDLSDNYLETLSAATFDGLDSIREIYLSNNRLRQLPTDLFVYIKASVKAVRLDGNPWLCTCAMTEWRPTITNRVKVAADVPKCDKQILFKQLHKANVHGEEDTADMSEEDCKSSVQQQHHRYKYVYDASVAPRCAEPRRYVNLSVFHAMRKMHCQNYTPKAVLRRHKMRKQKSQVSNEIGALDVPISTTQDAIKDRDQNKVNHIKKARKLIKQNNVL